MKLLCPNCQSPIEASDVNVATDLAKCSSCNELSKASELVADVDLREGLEPPAGSLITINSVGPECRSFVIPKRGVTGSDVFPMFFATFWVCFTAFLTWNGAQEGILPTAFSLLFVVFGLGMWRGILIGITETQELILGADMLTVFKKSSVSSRRLDIPYSEIESIDVRSFMPSNLFTMTRYMSHFTRSSGMWSGIPLATIVHGKKNTHIAENVSEAEREWLVTLLKAVVLKRASKRASKRA